jgi:hypothetical protein
VLDQHDLSESPQAVQKATKDAAKASTRSSSVLHLVEHILRTYDDIKRVSPTDRGEVARLSGIAGKGLIYCLVS